MTAFPKVTVAVPLYRSARFLDIVTDTLQTLDYPHLEVLISDRHHEDSAIDRLRETFGPDPRFRFLVAEDKLDWVAHYNLLLREATGEYFLWVSHDDSYTSNYLTALAGALNKHPEAAIAFGAVKRIQLDGSPIVHRTYTFSTDRAGSAVLAYRVTLSGGMQFHGMFRRNLLMEKGLFIRPTAMNIAADGLWIFALSYVAPVVFEGSCTFIKRYYPASAHRLWDGLMKPGYLWNFGAVAASYVDDYAPSAPHRAMAKVVIYSACAAWQLKLAISRWRRKLRQPQPAS